MTHLRSPLSQKFENDRICDEFESAWERHLQHPNGDDHRPTLEDYLGEVSGSQRSLLFRDLLALELACRARRGEGLVSEREAGRGGGRAGPDVEALAQVAERASWMRWMRSPRIRSKCRRLPVTNSRP